MTSPWRAVLIAVGIAILGSVWAYRSDDLRAIRPTAGVRVIAFGDSLVEGVGATAGHDVVSVLSERLGTPIINAGRRGDTTASALARLDGAVLSRNPRVVGRAARRKRLPPAGPKRNDVQEPRHHCGADSSARRGRRTRRCQGWGIQRLLQLGIRDAGAPTVCRCGAKHPRWHLRTLKPDDR